MTENKINKQYKQRLSDSQIKVNNISKKWKQNSPIKYAMKSRSLIINNPLTKSSFELNQTTLHSKFIVDRKKKPSLNSTAKLVQKYERFQILKNKANTITIDHNITSLQNNNGGFSSMPRINVNKLKKQSQSANLKNNDQKMKFKLLFRDQKKLMTLSQRKIHKLDQKIRDITIRNRKMTQLIPKPPKQQIKQVKKPRGVIIPQSKISQLIESIIKYSQLYFNIYQTSKRVGAFYKTIGGYNKNIQKVMMIDEWNARRVTSKTFLQQQFWVFKQQALRIPFFGEEDLNLYSNLIGFILNLQKNYFDQKNNFKQRQINRIKNIKSQLQKEAVNFSKKNNIDKKMVEITKFVENKKIFNYLKRQTDMTILQKRGVNFNIEQRCRQLILRERQNAFRKYKTSLELNKK